MKTGLALTFLIILGQLPQATAAVMLTPSSYSSLPESVTDEIVIDQSLKNNNIQIRYKSSGDIRSGTQTFTWNSTQAMSGVGVLLASTQSFTSTLQNYELRIFQVSGITNNSSVTSTLETYQFQLSNTLVVANNYLYWDFPTALELTNGSTYMFQLAPTGQNNNNVLYLARTDYDSYGGGSGAQLTTNASPTTVSSVGWDTSFFLTAVPEPGPMSLLIATFGAVGILKYRGMRKSLTRV